MRNPILHPSRKRLVNWVESFDPTLDPHLESCNRCTGILEEIVGPMAPMADALREALDVPADVGARIGAGIVAKMEAREDLRLLGDMFGVGFTTARYISDSFADGVPDPE